MTATRLWFVAAVALVLSSRGLHSQTYVGSKTCLGCHDDLKSFQNNPHHRLDTDQRRGWATKACEACHGPGGKHAESGLATDIVNPRTAAATQVIQLCLQCHLNEPTHVGRIQSGHARNMTACTACHTMHAGQDALVRRK